MATGSNNPNFRPPWMDVSSPAGPVSPQNPSDTSQQENLGPSASASGQSSPLAPFPSSPEPQQNADKSVSSPASASSESLIVSSPFKKIIPIVGVGIIILLIFFVLRTILTKKEGKDQTTSTKTSAKEITLTYWGLWEPEQIITPILDDYKKDHPNVTINYVFQSHQDYRERLQSALAAGKGPDIMRIHLTWLPMFKSQLAPLPKDLVDFSDYFPSISELKSQESYLALPLEFDSLALYYNTDLFTSAGQIPPTNWEELRNTAKKMTVTTEGKIQTAGIALGTTSNVDNWSDILALMMLQNGADLNNPTGKFAEDSLKFYTLFSKVDRVWDETLPASTYAFATGKVAMIFAPSWRVFEIKEINPKLNFKTVPVPQLPGTQIAWATFWAEAVSKTSPNQEAAFEFLKYLSQKENLKKLYTYQGQARLFGEPYPLRSLSKELETDPIVGAFVKQGSYAKTWYLCSRTHDNGINDRMIKYFEDAVNGVLQGKGAEDALKQAATGVTQVLNQYQITSKSP